MRSLISIVNVTVSLASFSPCVMFSSIMFLIFFLQLINLFVHSHDIDELKPIGPRKSAPLFKAKAVLNDKFVDITLDQFIKEAKWTVLLFYPFDYTFVCPTEIISFSDHNHEFIDINTQVLAISTDSHHTHLG